MDIEKWIGSWNITDEDQNGSRKVSAKIVFGIIPSIVVIGLIAVGIYQWLK